MSKERDYAAERYNRRTRAIEKQAAAMTDMARAFEVVAIATVAATRAPTTTNGRVWSEEVGSELMQKALAAVRSL